MSTILNILGTFQRQLFPSLECEIGPLTEKEKNLIQIIAFLDLPRHLSSYQWQGWGRKPKSRLAMQIPRCLVLEVSVSDTNPQIFTTPTA